MNISLAGAVSRSAKRGRSPSMPGGPAAVNRAVARSRVGKHVRRPWKTARQKPEIGEECMTGTIRTLRVDKGFGFIKGETGKEYFFHQSAIYGEGIADLREGDGVEFEVEDSPKGPRAANVKRTTT